MSANSVQKHLHERYVTEFIQKQPAQVLHHYLMHMRHKANVAYSEFDHKAELYYTDVAGLILKTIRNRETTTR